MELWDRGLGNEIKEGTEGCDEEYSREIGKITKCTARELLLGKIEENIEGIKGWYGIRIFHFTI